MTEETLWSIHNLKAHCPTNGKWPLVSQSEKGSREEGERQKRKSRRLSEKRRKTMAITAWFHCFAIVLHTIIATTQCTGLFGGLRHLGTKLVVGTSEPLAGLSRQRDTCSPRSCTGLMLSWAEAHHSSFSGSS